MHYVKRVFTGGLYAGAALYSGGLLAFALLWGFAPEATWWIALSNVFAALFFIYDLNGRLNQVEGLLDELAPIQGPLIVLGDFNTGDREPGYAAMRAQFRDLFRETTPGFGYTFPYQRRMGPLYIPVPLVRIDYVWARGPLTPLATSIHCITGSDHCMIVADLRLATP